MLTVQKLIERYAHNIEIVKAQTAGLTHADSLVQLPFRANCMNWIIGHLVANRYSVLKLLGVDVSHEWQAIKRYAYDSEPVTGEGPGVIPLGDLLEILAQAQKRIERRTAEMSADEFSQPAAPYGDHYMPLDEWILFYLFHDSYHLGQTEIMRQAAGKNDKII